MQRITLLLIIIFLVTQNNFAQEGSWIQYTKGTWANCIVDDFNHLWVGTESGLAHVNKGSRESTIYNTANSGLPDNTINGVAEDAAGNVWIATKRGGLAKYDGMIWTVYNSANTGMPIDKINSIAIEDGYKIWLGTDYGLVAKSDDVFTLYNTSNSQIPTNSIGRVTIDENNTKWFGGNFSLVEFKGNEFIDHYIWPENTHVNKVFIASNDTMWLATTKGLFRKTGPYIVGLITASYNIYDIAEDVDGNLWFGTTFGLLKFNGVSVTNFYNSPNITGLEDYIYNVSCFDGNKIWFSGYFEGLCLLDNEEIYKANISNSPMVGDRVTSIFLDDDIKWFCTNAGVVKYDDPIWTVYDTTSSQLPSNTIYDFFLDKETGKKWYATDKGFSVQNVSLWSHHNINNFSLTDNRINCFAKDSSGNIWIGTYADGAYKYDGVNYTHYTFQNSGLPSKNVHSIKVDKNNNVWFATDGGIGKYDGTNWEDIFYDHCLDMDLDSNNTLWVGTNYHGLYSIKDSIIVNFSTNNNTFPSNKIPKIRVDKNNIKWFGTANGLIEYDDTTFTQYTVLNSGLSGQEVYDIDLKETNNKIEVWLSTSDGASVFNPNNVVPVELTSFSANSNNGIVSLSWKTATETNNNGFEIQRMKDNNRWENIGFIKGNGTTSKPQEYFYIDNSLTAGSYSYRLKQIDYDGTFEYSKTISLNVNMAIFSFNLSQNYPNPFNPSTTIKFAIPQNEFVTLKIYDILGKEVTTLINEEMIAGNYTKTWDANNLSSGVYFYKLTAGKFTETKKMMLVR